LIIEVSGRCVVLCAEATHETQMTLCPYFRVDPAQPEGCFLWCPGIAKQSRQTFLTASLAAGGLLARRPGHIPGGQPAFDQANVAQMSQEDHDMKHSTAQVESERASIYLQQLCKHFAHKLAVEFTPERGMIPFSVGTCRLEAVGNILTLRAEAEDDERLAQLQDIIARHLLRFAFRAPPEIVWRATEGAPR
jgi:hypothetical protein